MRSDFPLGAALGAMGYRNRIINPRSSVDQRHTGNSVTPGLDGQYCADHWRARMSQASKFSVQTLNDNTFYNYGLSYNTLITSLFATALGVNDFFAYEQPVEGFLTSDFGWGGANPRPAMVQWVVQSSIPGSLSGYVFNELTNESAMWQRTLLANTATKISVPILHNGNNGLNQGSNAALVMGIGLGAGANFTSAATSGWSVSHKFSTPGDMGFITNAGATLRIGVAQLKPLPYITPFDLVDPATELEQCMRYYQRRVYGAGEYIAQLMSTVANQAVGKLFDFSQMRTAPSVSTGGNFVGFNAAASANTALTDITLAANGYGQVIVTNATLGAGGFWAGGGSVGLIAGGGATGIVDLDAEF